MLQDLLVYSHFGGFFLGTYISYSGRRFNLNYFLNIQGSKIVSAFLAYPKNSQINEKNFKFFVNSLDSILQNKLKNQYQINLKNKPEFQNFKIYEKMSTKIFDNYIKSNLIIDEIAFEKLLEIPDMYDSMIVLYLIKSFWPLKKKAKTFLHTISLIYTKIFQNDIYIDLFFLDATSSGLQIISMFLKDKSLSSISNLTGNTYYDIYQNGSDEFLLFFNQISTHIPYFFDNKIFDLKCNFNVLFNLLKDKDKVIENENEIDVENHIINFSDIIFFIRKTYPIAFMQKVLEKSLYLYPWIIRKYKTFLIPYDKAFEENIISNTEHKFILSCLVINSFKDYVDIFKLIKVPFEVLHSREVFKALIMKSI